MRISSGNWSFERGSNLLFLALTRYYFYFCCCFFVTVNFTSIIQFRATDVRTKGDAADRSERSAGWTCIGATTDKERNRECVRLPRTFTHVRLIFLQAGDKWRGDVISQFNREDGNQKCDRCCEFVERGIFISKFSQLN